MTQNFYYDELGNMTDRSDLGIYSYKTDTDRTKPHAVKEIALIGGGKQIYACDDNSYRNSRVVLAATSSIDVSQGRIENCTSFNMPQSLKAPGMYIRETRI